MENRSAFYIAVLLAISCLTTMCSSCDSFTIKRISVYPQNDKVSCEFDDTNMTYSSVSDLEIMITNCSIVYFCSHLLLLNESVRLANLHDVTFIGLNETIIDCNGLHGFEFMNMTDLTVKALEFSKCVGNYHSMFVDFRGTNTFHFKAGIYILGLNNLNFTNVTVSGSTGMGVSVFETRGFVIFSGCTFRNNGKAPSRGSTGIFVSLSSNHSSVQDIQNSTFRFDRCLFVGNLAYEIDEKVTPFGRGGGLRIFIRDSSSYNKISINHCTFNGNIASRWGGALFVSLHDSSIGNSIIIQNTTFTNNSTPISGGATYVGFICGHDVCLNNSYLFHSCLFENNTGVYGGGSTFTSTRIYNSMETNNKLMYRNCTWRHNYGHFGSAISIIPDSWSFLESGVFPTPEFKDCMILGNCIKDGNLSTSELPKPYRESSMGVGALYCALFKMNFTGKVTFADNNGSAILATSCYLSFQESSIVTFHNNTGYFGGALYLLGYSTIFIQRNSLFTFSNNTADADGGAIYYRPSGIFEHDYSDNCFIAKTTAENITFNFSGNHALAKTAHGLSIYALSLLPCIREYSNSTAISDASLNKIANFTFQDYSRNDISTGVSAFTISDNKSENFIPVIPGMITRIPFKGHDDLDHGREEVYRLTLKKEVNSSVNVDVQYSNVVNEIIKLYGAPGDEATIMLTTTKQYKISLAFKVRLQDCPPGYILLNNSCICSAESAKPYIGIKNCDDVGFQAHREDGYWYGYVSNDTKKLFVTGYCAVGACLHSEEPLPVISNANSLSDAVCESSRAGIMCSKCVNGTSVYYHSPTFKCGRQDKCHLGWLFYILSELVPVTIIFIIVIAFNISFTSGLASGFIFYAQIINFFDITIHGSVQGGKVKLLNKINCLLYTMFNLEFFNMDELSFCLMKTDNTLNLLIFEYATFSYSFMLILLIIFILKVCDTRRTKLFFKLRIQKIQTSIIHGMSAFLILCYAHCAKVTFFLLSYSPILGRNGVTVETVVYNYGEIEWFGSEHLKYAIPAILIGTVIMFVPMIALLLYPICYKCLALLKIEDTKCVRITCKILPIEKLRPFFDSFQSCFKDDYRFFSGLYLLYRVLILANLFMNYVRYSYIVLEIQLLLMLILHAMAQPYKQRRHNIIDSLLFIHMALINALTMFNFTEVKSQYGIEQNITLVAYLQSVLIVLPLLCAVLYCGWHTVKTVLSICLNPASDNGSSTSDRGDLMDYTDLRTEQSKQESEALLSHSASGNHYTY